MSPLHLPLLLLAAAPAEARLDLARVAAAALQHAPRAGAVRARAESARLGAELRQPSPYPELTLGGRLWAMAQAQSGGADLTSSDPTLTTRYRLYATLRLSLLRAAAAHMSAEVVRAAETEGQRDAAVQRSMLLRDVGLSYVLLRATHAAAPSHEALCEARERQLQVARTRLGGGMGTTAEVVRIEEALRAAQLLRDEARRGGETAQVHLEALSGMALRGATLLPIAGAGCEDPAVAARRAAVQRPEVQLRHAEAARLRAQSQLAWRDALDVTLGLGASHGTTGTLDELNGLSALLEIRGGLDAPIRARKQTARDLSLARVAQLEAAATAEQVAFEARTACDALQRALAQVAVLEARVRATRSEYERLQSRRALVVPNMNGVVEMPQLLEAGAAHKEAEAQLIEARGQAELGQLNALLAQGETLAEPREVISRSEIRPRSERASEVIPSPVRPALYAALGSVPTTATAEAPAAALEAIRGLWVWHTRRLLAETGGPEALRALIKGRRITEIYLSIQRGVLLDKRLSSLVSGLRGDGVRVEALLGEAGWYAPARHAEMLGRIGEIAAWNAAQGEIGGAASFDGVHLDIEPQQLPRNQGARNLGFLPDLIAALRIARQAAAQAGLSIAADIPRKVLRASAGQRLALGAACPRLFLMAYETRSLAEITQAARLVLSTGAQLVVALRPQDHEEQLANVLDGIGEALGRERGYLGWAVHDYESYRKR